MSAVVFAGFSILLGVAQVAGDKFPELPRCSRSVFIGLKISCQVFQPMRSKTKTKTKTKTNRTLYV